VRIVSNSLPFEEAFIALQRTSWQLAAAAGVACLVFPSVFISQLRSRQDHSQMYYPQQYAHCGRFEGRGSMYGMDCKDAA